MVSSEENSELPLDSCVKGIVYSAYDKRGPQPLYTYPKIIPYGFYEDNDDEKDEQFFKYNLRNFVQISIKSLSLLIGEQIFSVDENTANLNYFGILPYPDFNVTSLVYFHFIRTNFSEKPIASTFSILVDENRRSYLYNNIERLKAFILNTVRVIDKKIENGFIEYEEVEPIFIGLNENLMELEKNPIAPITSSRKLKIIFAGLDNSGKTSFLLTIDRRYSKLMGLKPTIGVDIKHLETLGASVFTWDLGGQQSSRDKYVNKADIYLYDADLLYYFVDVRDINRLSESMMYFRNVLENIKIYEQKTPVVIIISKVDMDIRENEEIQESIKNIIEEIEKLSEEKQLNVKYFLTSIFSVFSVLRAFSFGLSQMSPNRELINSNLSTFSKTAGVNIALLMNSQGLVLADYYDEKILREIQYSFSSPLIEETSIKSVFEIVAPQLANLFKIFEKFKEVDMSEATYKIGPSDLIVIKKIMVYNNPMFLLLLLDDAEKNELVEKILPTLLKSSKDLIMRYIS